MQTAAEGHSVRKALYTLFGDLLAEPPDAGRFGQLRDRGLVRLASAQGVDLLSDLLDPADAEASAAELQAEFEALFGRVPLRASHFEAGAQDPAVAIGAFLHEHTLRIDAGARLETDHAAVVLGIMAALLGAEEAAIRAEDAVRAAEAESRVRAFLRRHVLSWMPAALAEVSARSDRRFYRGVAAMLTAFLESERRLLGAE